MDEEKVPSLADLDPEIIEHFAKVTKSRLNNLFDGHQAVISEQFYRWVTGEPFLAKEEVQEGAQKWADKEKEIWEAKDGY